MSQQPAIQKLVSLIRRRLTALGHWPQAAEVERIALKIHRSMGGRSRLFHSRRHAVAMTEGADPIAALAALFHDTVYVQVDLGLPPAFADVLSRYAERDGGGYRVGPKPPGFLAELFGFRPGDALSPFAGLNEYLSAAAAMEELGGILSPTELAEVASCIEGTIPFRGNAPFARLALRLRDMDLPEDTVRRTVERAVWVSHKDVENFAFEDCGRFLDNTWLLLPETNPALLSADVYTIRDYRTALFKMEGFVASLSGERVFHRWGSFPDPELHARLVAAANRNITVTVRYLRAKLAASGLLEALAETTGGDAPISLFMGGRGARRRLEHWLPASPTAEDCDPVILRLLEQGRPAHTSFDIRRAPLASFIYRALGAARTETLAGDAKAMFRGELSAAAFLRAAPEEVVEPTASAAARMAATREPALTRRPWLSAPAP